MNEFILTITRIDPNQFRPELFVHRYGFSELNTNS
jgi:hypothetical protein